LTARLPGNTQYGITMICVLANVHPCVGLAADRLPLYWAVNVVLPGLRAVTRNVALACQSPPVCEESSKCKDQRSFAAWVVAPDTWKLIKPPQPRVWISAVMVTRAIPEEPTLTVTTGP